MIDPTLYYLDESVQHVVDRLAEQVGSLRALSALMSSWLDDLRHADADMLTGMASLVRLQGRELVRLADDLDAALRRAAAGRCAMTQEFSSATSFRERLGIALQKQRQVHGLSQAQLSKLAKLSLKYVGEIERGEANTSMEALERLTTALEWDPFELDPRPSWAGHRYCQKQSTALSGAFPDTAEANSTRHLLRPTSSRMKHIPLALRSCPPRGARQSQ